MTDARRARLAEITAREQAATPGPWKRDPYDRPDMQVVAHGNEVVIYHYHHQRQIGRRVVPNHEFVAHAREDIPWLLADIARLEAERDALEQRLLELAVTVVAKGMS